MASLFRVAASSRRLVILGICTAFTCGAAPGWAEAQATAGSEWEASIGGGIARGAYRSDDGRDRSIGGIGTVEVWRRVGSRVGIGAQWMGAWFEGDFGPQSRHHVGLATITAGPSAPLGLRLSLGLGTATVVTMDRAPDGLPGDIDVGTGGEVGLSGLLELRPDVLPRGPVHVIPAAGLLIQGVSGGAFVTAVLTARIRIRWARGTGGA